MVNLIKINKWQDDIAILKEKLNYESDFKKKDKLRLKIKIIEMKIKIERLNF